MQYAGQRDELLNPSRFEYLENKSKDREKARELRECRQMIAVTDHDIPRIQAIVDGLGPNDEELKAYYLDVLVRLKSDNEKYKKLLPAAEQFFK